MWVIEDKGEYYILKKYGQTEYVIHQSDLSNIYDAFRKYYGDVW